MSARKRTRLGVVIAATLAAAAPLGIVHAEPTMQELLDRIEQQDQAIKVLERKLEIQDENTKAAAKAAPAVKASEKGFSFGTTDNANVIKLRGVLQADFRSVLSDDATIVDDQFLLRRVRPTIDGTLGGIYDFRFTPDFAGGRTVIQDAFITGRFAPYFQATIGKFKAPVGLERLQSATDMRFIERAYPTQLVPNRDIGLQIAGGGANSKFQYQIAYLNGSNDGRSAEDFSDVDVNDDKEYAARIFLQPFIDSDSFALRGLGFGIGGSWTSQEGTATQTLLPQFRTPAQSVFFRYNGGDTPTVATGDRVRIAPQFYYSNGGFGLLGEWTQSSQDVTRTTAGGTRSDTIDTTAWQLAASLFLTGEDAAFRGYKPNSSFSLDKGTWGAWELAARYSELDIDDAAFEGGSASFANPANSASKASSISVGLNWYLNQNVKWSLNYEHTSFDGGAENGDREDEKAILTRVGIGF